MPQELKDFISVCDACRAVEQTLPKRQIPWPLQSDDAPKKLLEWLKARRLVAYIVSSNGESSEVPEEYWIHASRAIATLKEGRLDASRPSADPDFILPPELARLDGCQVFLVKSDFEDALKPGIPAHLLLRGRVPHDLKDFISICDACRAVEQAFPERRRPWIRLQEPLELDEAQKQLLEWLKARRLVAYVVSPNGKSSEVPEEYWIYTNRAITTLKQGRLQASRLSADPDFILLQELACLDGCQFFLIKSKFEDVLKYVHGSTAYLWLAEVARRSQPTAELLFHDALRLRVIINIARGANLQDWHLDQLWRGRVAIIEDAIFSDELRATLIPGDHDGRYTTVQLADLWEFLCSKSLLRSLDWLRDFCWNWAEVRGEKVEELQGTSADRLSQDHVASVFSQPKLENWYRMRVKTWPLDKRPPSRSEDWAAAKEALSSKIPREAVWNARGKFAPDSWRARGRPKNCRDKSDDQ